jgi:hypothetical protein
MVRPAILLVVCLLVSSLLIIGCGGTAMMNGATVSTRALESITVSPSSADAHNFPNSQVQFMATGMFNMSPTSVTSMPVMWSVGNPAFMSPTPMPMSMRSSIFASASGAPTIDGNGVAQCNGFVGIATIEATAPSNPNTPLSQMNSMMSVVTGRANLTCP